MKTNIAVNGFGRIGRGFLRSALNNNNFCNNFNIVAINDITDIQTLAHLLKYDSIFGKYPKNVVIEKDNLIIDSHKIKILAERDPEKLPWKDLNVQIVLESTGFFTKNDQASKHIIAGAKRVIISAPSNDPDVTLVLGVNEEEYDSTKHFVISMASCTTNCLAPVIKIINNEFGIEKGFLTTTHAYTSDQKLHDTPHKDLRRARASNLSIIPTTTGAAKSIGEVIPDVNGKLDGLALRVPVPVGSINDITLLLNNDVKIEQINNVLKKSANNELKGILEYTEEPIVSSDVIGNSHSSIIDGLSTNVIGNQGKLIKIMAWYDNESGFSNRLVDIIQYISK